MIDADPLTKIHAQLIQTTTKIFNELCTVHSIESKFAFQSKERLFRYEPYVQKGKGREGVKVKG